MPWASWDSLVVEIVDVVAEWLCRWRQCRARPGWAVELLVDGVSSADFVVPAVLVGAGSAGPSLQAD